MMVYASYHSQLEISFCMDEFAIPVSNEEEEQSLDDSDEGPVIKPNKQLLYRYDVMSSSMSDIYSKTDLDETMISNIESGLDIAMYCKEKGGIGDLDMTLVSEHFTSEDEKSPAVDVMSSSIVKVEKLPVVDAMSADIVKGEKLTTEDKMCTDSIEELSVDALISDITQSAENVSGEKPVT